jgi:uncharacterized protein (DUF342 family)
LAGIKEPNIFAEIPNMDRHKIVSTPPADLPLEHSAFQPEQSPGQKLEKPKEIPLDLIVSEDQLQAHICARGEGTSSVTVEDIKTFLKEKGIAYGWVDDSQIREYLSLEALPQKLYLIAEGKPAKLGKDAEIIYFFDRDPLKIGSVRAGGSIDFKDKGEIPQVKQGALLAEKIPLVKEELGKDVYGKAIPAEKAKDIQIRCGTGTKKSADALRVYAGVGGRPELLADGRVCVFPELRIEGDVGLETGHVRFDGFVNVSGIIQEGFRVKGGRLAAKEIYRAEVEVDGDIVVDGGIIGAKIITMGNLKTRYIHSSQIEASGDVIVEGEVIDSKIEINGALIATRSTGKIFSSQITAKKGIEAKQIGSETSKPCALVIGVDSNTKKILNKLKREISLKEEEKGKVRNSIEKLEQELLELANKIGKMAQFQDRANIEQRSCKKKIEALKGENDLVRLAEAEAELKNLEEKVRSVQEPLGKLLDQQDQDTDRISAFQVQIQELDQAIQALEDEILATIERSKIDVGVPVAKVHHLIFSGTTVEGCHSSIVLEENYLNALLRETKMPTLTPKGEKVLEWKISVASLL